MNEQSSQGEPSPGADGHAWWRVAGSWLRRMWKELVTAGIITALVVATLEFAGAWLRDDVVKPRLCDLHWLDCPGLKVVDATYLEGRFADEYLAQEAQCDPDVWIGSRPVILSIRSENTGEQRASVTALRLKVERAWQLTRAPVPATPPPAASPTAGLPDAGYMPPTECYDASLSTRGAPYELSVPGVSQTVAGGAEDRVAVVVASDAGGADRLGDAIYLVSVVTVVYGHNQDEVSQPVQLLFLVPGPTSAQLPWTRETLCSEQNRSVLDRVRSMDATQNEELSNVVDQASSLCV